MNNILVLISEEFDIKNSFLREISDLSEFLDFRPPFENEMKKWVRYILKSNDIEKHKLNKKKIIDIDINLGLNFNITPDIKKNIIPFIRSQTV